MKGDKFNYLIQYAVDHISGGMNGHSGNYYIKLPTGGRFKLVNFKQTVAATFDDNGTFEILSTNLEECVRCTAGLKNVDNTPLGEYVKKGAGSSASITDTTDTYFYIKGNNIDYTPQATLYFNDYVLLQANSGADDSKGVLDASHLVTLERSIQLTFEQIQ